MANIESFAFLGIRGLAFKDRESGDVECYLKHLVNVQISDGLQSDFLRGGMNNEKLLVVYGDRDSKLTASTATQTTELIKIMSNSDSVEKIKTVDQIEEIGVSGGKFTLKLEAKAGEAMTIYSIAKNGKSSKLTLGSPSTNQGEYSVTTSNGKTVITCHASVIKIRAHYASDEQVTAIEVKDITPKNWCLSCDLVAKEVETGKLYICSLEVPNASVTPNFAMSAENTSGAPAAVDLEIEMLKDEGKGFVYSLNFKEEV